MTGTSGKLLCCLRESGLLSCYEAHLRIPLKSKQVNQPSTRDEVGTTGSSHVVVGSSGFLSICDLELREPLVMPQGSQAPFRVGRGTSGFLSSCCSGIGPHFKLRLEIRGFVNSCYRNLGVPMEFQQER